MPMSRVGTNDVPTLRRLLLGMALIMLAAPALARDAVLAALPDPTRPDLGLSVEQLLARDPDAQAAAADQGKAGPAAAAAKPVQALALAYTLVSKSRRIAVINGKAVAEGETVAGAKVLRIKPDQVTIEREGEQQVLNLAGYRKKVDEPKAGDEKAAATAAADAAAKTIELPVEKGSNDGAK